MLKNVFGSETERMTEEKGKWRGWSRKPEVPEGMFQKCEYCKKILYSEDVKKNFRGVCEAILLALGAEI